MKLPFSVFALVAIASNGYANASTTTCPPAYKSVVAVTCTAQDGMTEEQFPKDKYPSGSVNNAAPGTDCNAIPVPTDVNWKYCLRTIQLDYNWKYIGPANSKLVSIKRLMSVDPAEYPDGTNKDLVPEVWGEEIWFGWRLSPDTYWQIVVDLCQKPMTYTAELEVVIEQPNGQQCTTTAEYVYEITANLAEEEGYQEFKNTPAEVESGGEDVEAFNEGIEGNEGEPPAGDSTSAASTVAKAGIMAGVSAAVGAFFM